MEADSITSYFFWKSATVLRSGCFLKVDISKNAKLLYALLSDRTTLSQKNALNELDEAGLLERKRAGFSASNRLYVKLSPFFQIPDPMMEGKTSPNNIAANGKAYQTTPARREKVYE